MLSDYRRRWIRRSYAFLLRFYPKEYFSRFSKGMEQTFNDLLNEHVNEGRGLLGFILWTFRDTLISILEENMKTFSAQGFPKKQTIGSFFVAVLLIMPLAAMQVAAGVLWDASRLGFMVALLLGGWFIVGLLSTKSAAMVYRAGVAIAVFAVLNLTWVTLYVGILGDHKSTNALYLLVPMTGFVGAYLVGYKPRGMALTSLLMASAMVLVTSIALPSVQNEVRADKQFFGATGQAGVVAITGLFTILFVASAILFWIAGTMGRRRSIELTTAISLGLILTWLSSKSSRAEESLPDPTGSHKIGRTSVYWRDDSRGELETSAPDDKREMIVHLFYPTDANSDGDLAVYVPDADVMRGLWDDAQLARVTNMSTHCVKDAPLSSSDARYPVVVFSPGGGLKSLTYHALLEDLASHGWIVAAIDPPYNARAMRMPDGRVLGNLQPKERGWPEPRNAEDDQRYYKERVVHWARDLSFAIDQLTRLNKSSPRFANRLDLERGVGVFGHSRGGQAAVTVGILDARVRGRVNIDGMADDWAVIPVENVETSVGESAFLWIQRSLPPPPTDDQLQSARMTRAEFDAEFNRIMEKWRRQMSAIPGGAVRLSMKRQGITHIDFSDEPLWDGSMTEENRPSRLQTISDTREWLRGFFDATIRNDVSHYERLLDDAGRNKSNFTVHTFGTIGK